MEDEKAKTKPNKKEMVLEPRPEDGSGRGGSRPRSEARRGKVEGFIETVGHDSDWGKGDVLSGGVDGGQFLTTMFSSTTPPKKSLCFRPPLTRTPDCL